MAADARPPAAAAGRKRGLNPASVAAVESTTRGHLGLLSAVRTNRGTREEMERLSRYTPDEWDRAKEVQDRLAACGVGVASAEESAASEAHEQRANADFIRRLDSAPHRVPPPAQPGTGWDYADHSLNHIDLDNGHAAGLFVDPRAEGARVHYENGEEGVQVTLRAAWVDPLAARALPPPAALPPLPAEGAPRLVEHECPPTVYEPGAVEALRRRVQRMGADTDAYLRLFYRPAAEYNRAEFVSAETENRFRAWTSAGAHNERTLEAWIRLVRSQAYGEHRDTVHVDGAFRTLVFCTSRSVFLNVILEAVGPAGASPPLYRIHGHYYTFSLQACTEFVSAGATAVAK